MSAGRLGVRLPDYVRTCQGCWISRGAYDLSRDPKEEQIRHAESLVGRPRVVEIQEELLSWELDLIEKVCGDTRSHDLTIFLFGGDQLALVHKPGEPQGAYWAPAGGLEIGEDLVAAAEREAMEETGIEAVVERYVLRVNACFTSGERVRPWSSHVFVAQGVGGRVGPLDTKEVDHARWISVNDFRSEVAPVLLRSGWGRFRYRLRMAAIVFSELGVETEGLPKPAV